MPHSAIIHLVCKRKYQVSIICNCWNSFVIPYLYNSTTALCTDPDWVRIVQKIFSVTNRLEMVKIIQKICFCQNYGAIVDISQPIHIRKM